MNAKSISNTIDLVLRAVALAMGVAVIVLNILGVLLVNAQVLLLGIGLFCLAVSYLDRK
ncbi:MAG: hypothetical protein ACWGO1_09335 [Anaerolineales bacterium]